MPIADAKFKRFNRANISKAPKKTGVYALYTERQLIYLGKASSPGVTIRGMLRRHLDGRQGPDTAKATHYKREPSANAKVRVQTLLREYMKENDRLPPCNLT